MSDKPWIDKYEPREWSVYDIPISDKVKFPPTHELDSKIEVCDAESPMAKYVWTGNHFFVDMELMATDLPMTAGCGRLEQLSEDWNGHEPGALVMLTYIKVTDDPPMFTFLVEQTKAAN